MNLTLKIWRQKNANEKGRMVEYKVTDISEHMSFLEMMDILNESLVAKGEEPVAFDHDCREGSVVCVRFSSMGKLMGLTAELLHVSCICVCSMMVIPSLLSLGEQPLSL